MQPDPMWTAGHAPSLPREGLHETLAGVARRSPDAVALVSADQMVTYGELDRVADAWAAQMAAAGVAPGHNVPILVPRSTSLVTALVAVLKTGAAYALLDPAWPPRRVLEVLDELDAPLLVTAHGAADDLAGVVPIPTWQPPTGPVAAPSGFQPFAADGSEACCIFFTSGTTGRPRGVLSPHRATARLFCEGSAVPRGAGRTVPLAASLPWDGFSLELWSMLLTGGTCLVLDEPYLSAEALRRSVARHGVDTVFITTSLFAMVVDEDVDAFAGVQQVWTGGERMPPGQAARFLRRHPGARLMNDYGPVEATGFATTHRVTEDDCADPLGIPLGRPVPGTEVHVLDGERTCAVGEVGEICIAGQALARGYLGDPALTEAKFRLVDLEGRAVRVYRTGDLGSWEADGLLRFHGRADRQVKVRGHRVELAEVERQVEELLPAVRSCRVLAVRNAAGATRELVAFCAPAGPGDRLDGASSVLAASLVSYQRPAAVVSVDAFPLTPQGKLDERALLALVPDDVQHGQEAGSTSADDGAAGSTGAGGADDLERLVASTFAEVLGRPGAPLDASFFDLGGDSLGAGRVCARLAARTGRAVQVSWLYRAPTAAGLAQRLHRDPGPDAGPVVSPGPADGRMPLTPMQTGYLAQHVRQPDQRAQHCLLAWRIEGDLDLAALRAAVAGVHQRHEALRVRYALRPPVAGVVDAPPPLPRVLPPAPSAEAAVAALRAELAGALDLAGGVLWRTALVPVGASGDAVFGCAVHHIAFDGWSESVLADDLAAAYGAALTGAPAAERPPLPSWAQLQQDRLRRTRDSSSGAEQDSAVDDLVDEVRGAPRLRWPDPDPDAGPAPAVPAGAHHLQVPLSPQVVAAVDAAAAQAGTTRFGVLLSLCASSLAAATDQRDLVVCFPAAQRDSPLVERVIGCYVEMVFVRLRGPALSGDVQAARSAGQAVHRAIAQDVSLGRVMRRGGPPAGGPPTGGPPTGGPRTGGPPAGGGSPLFQVFFALQNSAVPHLRLPGVRTTLLRQDWLELPYEFHAELYPDDAGGLCLAVSWRPGVVADATAHEFQRCFTALAETTRQGT